MFLGSVYSRIGTDNYMCPSGFVVLVRDTQSLPISTILLSSLSLIYVQGTQTLLNTAGTRVRYSEDARK